MIYHNILIESYYSQRPQPMHNVVHSTTMYYVQLIVPRLLQIPKLGDEHATRIHGASSHAAISRDEFFG